MTFYHFFVMVEVIELSRRFEQPPCEQSYVWRALANSLADSEIFWRQLQIHSIRNALANALWNVSNKHVYFSYLSDISYINWVFHSVFLMEIDIWSNKYNICLKTIHHSKRTKQFYWQILNFQHQSTQLAQKFRDKI